MKLRDWFTGLSWKKKNTSAQRLQKKKDGDGRVFYVEFSFDEPNFKPCNMKSKEGAVCILRQVHNPTSQILLILNIGRCWYQASAHCITSSPSFPTPPPSAAHIGNDLLK